MNQNFLAQKTKPIVAGIQDRVSSLCYSLNEEKLNSDFQPLLDDLKIKGAISLHISDLGISQESWNVLVEHSTQLAESEHVISSGRDPNNSKDRKDFWYKLLGHQCVSLEQDSSFLPLVSNKHLMNLVNAYYQQYSWLMDFNIWLNLPSEKIKSSQMWHRDHVQDWDMNYTPALMPLLKVFFFIEDVDSHNGEFWFLQGSHCGGEYESIDPPKAVVEENMASRVSDSVMLGHVSKDKWLKFAGKAGTIVIFDASGFHKGGYVEEGRRLIFKSEYGSRSWIGPSYPKVKANNTLLKEVNDPHLLWSFRYPG